jgi:hypothetical protein
MQDGIDPLDEGRDLGVIRHTAKMRGIWSGHNLKANNGMCAAEALR